MSFRGRAFRGYFPPRGRGYWNWPLGPVDDGVRKENEGGSPEGEEEWEGEEEAGQGSGRGQDWARGGIFRGRAPLRGRGGNFHSFQKKGGDLPYPPSSSLTPHDILSWLDFQPPFAIQRVMFHCQWLLHQYGFPGQYEEKGEEGEEEDGEEAGQEDEAEEGPSGSWYSDVPLVHQGELFNALQPRGRGKRPGFGFPSGGQQHWTPAGWVTKDNSHKITTKMKPLPPQEIIPPFSNTYPDAAKDKEKLKLLINNHSMMSQELTKICGSFKIASLDKEDLSIYPEEQQGKLKTAINCVNNALKTLNDYKEFLKNDKYKAWNVEQKNAYDEKVKSMIGETPQGIPYKKPKVSDEDQSDEKCADEKAASEEASA